jgi:flagellar hook-basal body complex protein FliE
MLELLVGYWMGKRAQKNKLLKEEQKEDMENRITQSTYSDQDSRSFEQLLIQARENANDKQNNK